MRAFGFAGVGLRAVGDDRVGDGLGRQVYERIVTPTSRQVADAVSMFEQAINDHRLTHFDQPGLNDAAAHAKHRKIGDGYGYEPGDQNTDVMPLEAAALAYWNQKTSRRDPDRKQRMVRLA